MTNPTLERAARAAEQELGKVEMVLTDPVTLRRMQAKRIARAVLMAVLPDADKSGEAEYRFIQAILNDGEGE